MMASTNAKTTDYQVLHGATIHVSVVVQRTWRVRMGFWLFRASVTLAAWLMGCDVEVKGP